MSAPVTEAHLELAKTVIFSRDSAGRLLTAPMGAQLIADSEALATEQLRQQVANLEYSNNSHQETAETWRSAAIENIQLRAELATCNDASEVLVESLRAEVEQLKEYSANLENDVKYLTQGVPEGDPLFLAVARAERAEAELANIRALADRRNKGDHSQDTTHQLVVALDQALDIAQAELADEAIALRDMMSERDAAEAALTKERERLDWLAESWDNPLAINLHPSYGWSAASQNIRAAIDAAMKEETK